MARLNIALGLVAALAIAGSAAAEHPQGGATALWGIEARDQSGAVVKTVKLCADERMRQAFTRPLPEPNGQPCDLVGPTVQTAGRFAARCKWDGRHLDVQAVTTGDTRRDFTVKLLIRTDATGRENLVQTLRYRRLGVCPQQ